jgi:hypothetical protein
MKKQFLHENHNRQDKTKNRDYLDRIKDEEMTLTEVANPKKRRTVISELLSLSAFCNRKNLFRTRSSKSILPWEQYI